LGEQRRRDREEYPSLGRPAQSGVLLCFPGENMRGAAVQHGGVSDECAGGAKQELERGIRVGLWMREGRSRGWGVGGGRRRRKSSRGEEGSITWPLGEGDPRTSITPPTHKICLLPVMPTYLESQFHSAIRRISPHGQMKNNNGRRPRKNDAGSCLLPLDFNVQSHDSLVIRRDDAVSCSDQSTKSLVE